MIPARAGLVAQRLSRLHRMWEDAGSNPAIPVLSLLLKPALTSGRCPGAVQEALRRLDPRGRPGPGGHLGEPASRKYQVWMGVPSGDVIEESGVSDRTATALGMVIILAYLEE